MAAPIVVVGVDLAGSPSRRTGICTLRGLAAESADLGSDEEILDWILRVRPRIVGIDAPLTLPPGRRSLEDRGAPHLRACDREMLRRGIRFFPLTLGPMRLLTARGMALRRELARRGVRCIEVYPGGAQDAWRVPRKQHDLAGLRAGILRLGVRGVPPDASHDQLDAVCAALVCRAFVRGRAEVYGARNVAPFVMPRARRA